MTSELSILAARIRDFIGICTGEFGGDYHSTPEYRAHSDAEFNGIALMLFTLQFQNNATFRRFCESRNVAPNKVNHWTQIPAMPASAFKDFEISCLAPEKRTSVFHSSGTTGQRPSRHFHNAESLALYEASVLAFFNFHFDRTVQPLILTPPPKQAPNSSLVHMFDAIRRDRQLNESVFAGSTGVDGAWTLGVENVIRELDCACKKSVPLQIFGTAFSFVHLLDHLREKDIRFQLPARSCVLETGGYKGRSRSLPKPELHALIIEQLGVTRDGIICEYGMSELSSQAYDAPVSSFKFQVSGFTGSESETQNSKLKTQNFHFPPWARAQIISPENGREVADDETGLVCVFDLANVFSVLAIQTADLAVKRGDGFELIGRAEAAEPRGCSLMPDA